MMIVVRLPADAVQRKITQDLKFALAIRPDAVPESLAAIAMSRVLQAGWVPSTEDGVNYKELFEQALNDLVLLRAENEELKCQAR